MGPISAETSVDAPRERVFELLADLAVRPSFCDHFQHDYRLERLEPSGVGASARFRTGPRSFGTWMETGIAELEPPHLIVERGHCARWDRMPVSTAWELLEGPGTITTVMLSFGTEPADPLDRARERLGAGRWYRRQWGTALRRLTRVVEGDDPLIRVEVGGGDRVLALARG